MKKKQEVLDAFGELLIKSSYDDNYRILTKNLERGLKLNNLEGRIDNLVKEFLEGVLFDFLKIFEENEEFKLYYEKDDQKINLVEISEMLKAEPIIENGWIERFSEELKK